MNPQDHLVVRFLRFLNFNTAADRLVEALLDGRKVTLNPAIESAVSSILEEQEAASRRNFMFYSQDVSRTMFARAAKKYNLSELIESQIIMESPVAELS